MLESSDNNDRTELERTDLDAHVNVIVLARNFYIVNYLERIAEIHPFCLEHESLKVLIVDTIAQCDDPYSGKTSMLECKEVLLVPEMKCNIILPFFRREVVLVVSDLPKVQHK